MKRLLFILTLSLFYLVACSNADTHSHNGEEHTHESADHSHDHDAADHTHDHDASTGSDHDHDHADDHDHPHPHEQEEFTVESDSLRQDSLKSQQ